MHTKMQTCTHTHTHTHTHTRTHKNNCMFIYNYYIHTGPSVSWGGARRGILTTAALHCHGYQQRTSQQLVLWGPPMAGLRKSFGHICKRALYISPLLIAHSRALCGFYISVCICRRIYIEHTRALYIYPYIHVDISI